MRFIQRLVPTPRAKSSLSGIAPTSANPAEMTPKSSIQMSRVRMIVASGRHQRYRGPRIWWT
jgi:hypothetical protein